MVSGRPCTYQEALAAVGTPVEARRSGVARPFTSTVVSLVLVLILTVSVASPVGDARLTTQTVELVVVGAGAGVGGGGVGAAATGGGPATPRRNCSPTWP